MTDWGYGACHGPETWGNNYPAANGSRQSPIDIIVDQTEYAAALDSHKLQVIVNPRFAADQDIHYVGHNFKVATSQDSMSVAHAPGFTNELFKLVQYHFHWGNSENDNGSEHLINGQRWASELHLVHYNSTKYSNFNEASDKPDGLLVLGVLIKPGNSNPDIENLVKALKDIKTVKEVDLKKTNSSANLNHLLPKNTDRYFTYPGSLTTPPCYESVTWVVFEEALEMSRHQLLQFQKLHSNDKCMTSANFRPVCPLKGRTVKRSFK